jgi:WD40 repeat protein
MATMAAGGGVLVRRIADGRLERRFASEAKVTDLLFDAAGTHLAVVLPDSVRVWRIADGASVATLAIQKSRLLGAFDVTQDLALLRDSYASSGSVVRLTDGRTIVEHAGRPHLDFARRRIACVSGEQKIEVRELNNGRPLMNAFHEGVVSLELSPDGAHLVSAGTDGSARVWQLADGAELARLEHPDRVLDTCFSPDSRLIATVCSDDIVRLWTWRADDLIAEGQSRIPRRLSNAELDSFLPDPETRM